MIKKSESLSLAEVKELVKKLPKTEKTEKIGVYLKKFCKIDLKDAEKIRKEIQEVLPYLNKDTIAKIADLLPKDAEDLRKIVVDATLEENDTQKVLDIVKKYI